MGLSNWGFIKLSPAQMLAFFSMVEVLIYMDRSVFSSIVPVLKSSNGLNLSSSEAGLIGSIFILGYMVGSPLFAHYSQHYHPMFLMGIGLSIWLLATLGSGLATNYWILITARAFTGVGEASFICLAPPYISDLAPPSRRSIWLAVFYSSVNTGNAIGFAFGNYVRKYMGSWSWPLIIESGFMLPFILLSFLFYKDPNFLISQQKPIQSNQFETSEAVISLQKQIVALLTNKVYMILVAGFAAYIFTYGGWIFWVISM